MSERWLVRPGDLNKNLRNQKAAHIFATERLLIPIYKYETRSIPGSPPILHEEIKFDQLDTILKNLKTKRA